ncbi:uncharacterized protein LOC131687395 [Topomyia yanbarensis]|uniref:uncharacterized protein LOC131687395 n=1 Tax=Topomyia yanbarensis TaxID=2498891 RepID=UPI00273ACC2B|nr:uncharacterized protein LOC131687395 [Topomyia yanbarensis]
MKLQQQKELMKRQLELEREEQRRRHEAERLLKENEVEKKQLEIDSIYLQEKFRALEEDCDNDCDDLKSRKSAQSSISKVNQWRERHLGGLVNSTLVTQETVPVATTTSTAVVADPTHSDALQTVASSPAVKSVSNTLSTGIAATTPVCNKTSTILTTVQSIQSAIPAPISSSVAPVCANHPSVTQPVIQSAVGGPPNLSSLGGLLNRTSQQYPFWFPHGSAIVGGNPSIGVSNSQGCAIPAQIVNQGNSNYPSVGVSISQGTTIPVPVGNQGGTSNSFPVYFPPFPKYINQYDRHCPLPPELPWEHPPRMGMYNPPAVLPPTENEIGPTSRQLAARQVMSKELPPFSGNPEEWPLFISSFTNSTNACGFTNAENLMRLQRCLRGGALEAVRSRLLIPDSVPQVLATLQTLYGRPEILVYALLKKVREVPAPKSDKLETLIGFGMAVQNLCDHLHASNQEAHLNNPTLLYELVEKLPANLKLDWAMVKRQQPGADLRTFAAYMSMIVSAATEVTLTIDAKPNHQKNDKSKEKNFCNPHSAPTVSHPKPEENCSTGRQCLVCQDPLHKVKDCATFKKWDVDNRWKLVQKLSLCRICLFSHGRRPCKSKGRCGIDGCDYRHHPMLHSISKRSDASTSNNNAVQNHHHTGRGSLFRIVPVTLHGKTRSITTFAFLDDGSSITLVEDSITNFLDVDGKADNLCLAWTGNVTRSEEQSKRVKLDISGVTHRKKYTISEARTVKSLGLPRQTLCYKDLVERYPYLAGLPIPDYKDVVPKILIGNDNAHLSVTLKRRERLLDEPIGTKTRLGWSIHGPIATMRNEPCFSMHMCQCVHEDEDLHNIVKEYFSLENMGVSLQRNLESEENQRARRTLQITTLRVGFRFQIGLLWKYDTFEFPDSYFMAVRRLECLERRMLADPELGSNVRRQIEEYKIKGYIEKASKADLIAVDPRKVWYLPLGVVINPKKPGKIRIFCDAAAKVDGVSLNTMLSKGPDLLVPLKSVLTGFRERQIALCADVKEMFHQMLMRKEDKHAQRILWRDDPNHEPQVYFMSVATFGAASSPCSAQFVKNLNASEYADRYPEATDAIIRKHYVDDYLDSVDSEDEAIKRAKEVAFVHSRGGFIIRGWMSNSKEVLQKLGETTSADVKEFSMETGHCSERVLGVLWLPEEDAFTYAANFVAVPEWPTKRELLKTVMTFYDPLGFLSHFTIHGKILIQDVWRSKVTWDERIPVELRQRWDQWVALFPSLAAVRVPRCYFPRQLSSKVKNIQLHMFVDASLAAFACVAYLRAEVDGKIHCALVTGKAKVAPLKLTSVPRLELQAAVLGARLVEDICSTHTLPIAKRFIWTDSKTVLGWINSDQRRYSQFVAFRVGEILEKTRATEWRWIPSDMNASDDATKWKGEPNLTPEGRWFGDPEVLHINEEYWPSSSDVMYDTTEERRSNLVIEHHVVHSVFDWERFSKLHRLSRTVGYVVRYVGNLKAKARKHPTTKGPLCQEELATAETWVFRAIQKEVYPKEVDILSSIGTQKGGSKLGCDSRLFKLAAFIDEKGVMRMESRISLASFAAYDTRYPIILPRNHHVTTIIIMWYHHKFLHGNRETVINEMLQRFHVSCLRVVVRSVTRECQQCKIRKAKPSVPRMSPLPAARLGAFFRPFTFVGLDYFGPMTIRVGRSNVKRWVALFTCLSIRAVHLEVVHSLSTESCKMAIRRFVARRGSPSEIYSDNATNFLGACNELRSEIKSINESLAETFTNASTRWLFIPPSAPHMGGAWERMVRSVKTAFYAMTTTKLPTEEMFGTVLVEAEGIVNSRPLTFLALDEGNQESLTPNHFLLMSSNGVVQTQRKIYESNAICRSDWDHCRRMVDLFWRRWIREYLPVISRRTKWFGEVRSVKQGDLVIIIDDGLRNGWVKTAEYAKRGCKHQPECFEDR